MTNSFIDGIAATLNEHDHTEIFRISETASDKWRAIGRKLGFTMIELDTSVVPNSGHVNEMVRLGSTHPHSSISPKSAISSSCCRQRETSK